MPFAQQPWIGWMYVVIRTEATPAALAVPVREALRALDPELPFAGLETMRGRVADSLGGPRTRTVLLAGFALMAMVLAVGGLYGTMLFSVGQRAREIGIRIALGARLNAILRMVLGQGMALVGVGIAAGIAAAWMASRLLSSMVFGIEVTDLPTYTLSALALATVALAACFVPARRATRADPAVTLRHE
jgi:putative ABC transport system permease protein